MKIKFKNIIKILLYISVCIFFMYTRIYLKFYYIMYYWNWLYIDNYDYQMTDSKIWTWLSWMKKYCKEEWYKKWDVNCKPIILAIDDSVNTKNNSYIPWLEKYCTEEWFNKWDVNCEPSSILKPKFNPGNIINYPDWCLEQRCNLDINEYNFDFCFYQEIEKTEWKQIAETIVFYTKRIFYSDVSIIREHYSFKENCEFLEWGNISEGKQFFWRKNTMISVVDDAVNTKNNSYIPWLEKYCIEKGMKEYNISCYDWISEDSEKWTWVKYKPWFLYDNKYLYKYDECIYKKLIINKVINWYNDIIFYPNHYKIKDMIIRKKDVTIWLWCLDSE